MRGDDLKHDAMFSYISPEARVPQDHPLRVIRQVVDQILVELSPEFDRLYSRVGRPSVAPEKLLRALLLQILYTIRSERLLMEQLDYNLLFRWFVGLNMDDRVWDPTTFTKNRQRLLDGEIAQHFFARVLEHARQRDLLSDEHFTVDGTLIEAAASLKSFRPRDGEPPAPPDDPGNPTVNFRGERRSNATHQSTTDPDARLMKKGKGKEAKLVFLGHAWMETRHGLLVDFQVTPATGTAERDAVPTLLDAARERGFHPKTLGSDKNYDTQACVAAQRARGGTPHVAQNTTNRRSAIDGRTTRHPGYAVSQRIRKRVEEIFGGMKTVGGFRRTRYRGLERTGLAGYLVATADNLARLSRLLAPPRQVLVAA
jgi:transposase